jgi:hypothetical protein
MELVALTAQAPAQTEMVVATAPIEPKPGLVASNTPQVAGPAAQVLSTVADPEPVSVVSAPQAEVVANRVVETPEPEATANHPLVTEVLAEIGPNEEIKTVLTDWAAAWSGQDVEGYLDAYSDRFVPTGTQTLAQWEAQRRQRLARPERIEVELSEIEVLVFDARRARARVVQAYRSDRYSDVTRKEFQMVHEGGRWQITSERTLEVLER